MKLIDRFLSYFIPKRRRGRRRPYWTTSPFPKKVKEMVKLSETEARTQSAKLLEALLKIHRDTNFSECKADDNLLGLISNLMNGIEVEKRTVEEITLPLSFEKLDITCYLKWLFLQFTLCWSFHIKAFRCKSLAKIENKIKYNLL